MINLFEELTAPLTAKELKALEYIRSFFIVNQDYVTNNELIMAVNHVLKIKLEPVRVRAVIHRLRNDLPIVASSKGYKLAKDKETIREYIKSLEQRINSIQDVKRSMELHL